MRILNNNLNIASNVIFEGEDFGMVNKCDEAGDNGENDKDGDNNENLFGDNLFYLL